MYTFNYHFRSSLKEGNHPGHIFMRIIYQRKSITIKTPFNIYTKEWNKKENCLIIPDYNSPRYLYLTNLQKEMEKEKEELLLTINRLHKDGEEGLKEIIKHYRYQKNQHLLSVFTERLITQLFEAGQERTARAYKSVLRDLTLFNKGKEIVLKHIDENFLKLYEQYLKKNGKTPNTISFYMRNLRAIYHKAIQQGILTPYLYNPFKGVYTGVQKTRKRALSKKEIILLNTICFPENNQVNKKLPEELYSEPIQRTLLLFFFCFHAQGMSFVDMAYLRKDNIHQGIISYYRKKTGGIIQIKLTPILEKILKKFAAETDNSRYLFPIITKNDIPERRQYESALRIYNMRLNRIGELLEMKNALTSHVARHSWASVAKHENLPLWVISEGLGHHNEKTTYIYLSSLEQSMLDKANRKIFNAISGI